MDAPAAVEEHRTSTGLSNIKIAMWAFLASDCLLFGALISTFLLYHTQTGTGPTPAELYDIPFTSVSSFVLLMSSLTMVLALSAMQRGEEHRARAWLVATALLGLTFLSGQVYEFTTFVHEGAALTTSPFTSSFFLMTGFHGAHVAGGVLLLLTLTGMSLDGRLPAHRAETVEMAGLYWHFVDVVWIVIFAVAYLIPTAK
jgi:cytochrome c oxidase subunit 3/cytochrome o ubiquinol oxidase subunit 3